MANHKSNMGYHFNLFPVALSSYISSICRFRGGNEDETNKVEPP